MKREHPHTMYLLALAEMSGRFAFVGICNLLVIYLFQNKMFTEISAEHLFGLLTGTAFILPIIGGYFSDKLHHHLPIRSGIIASSCGCFLLATEEMLVLYPALLLLAVGFSILVPGIYALLHLVYKNNPLREGGFAIYYSAVNLGSFLGLIVLSFLGHHGYWQFAFFLAGIVQTLGWLPLSSALNSIPLHHFHKKVSPEEHPPFNQPRKDRIRVITILSLFSIVFWIGYNQGGSSLSLFALKFTDRSLGALEIPAPWFFSSEILYLILLTFPLIGLYLFLKKQGIDLSPFAKCAFSLVALCCCFIILKQGSFLIAPGDTSAHLNPGYLLGAYAFMALGEILIFPTGISLVTELAPASRTAFFVGVWYFCIGLAFYLGGLLAPLMLSLQHVGEFFNLFIIAGAVTAFLFFLSIPYLKRKSHLNLSR